jgi:predicted ATPase
MSTRAARGSSRSTPCWTAIACRPRSAAALGERDLTGELLEVIAARIDDAPTLLLLDNCEHLLQPVAALVDQFLRRCSSLTIVATSREPLGVPGETAWRVPSMTAPQTLADTSVDALIQFDAVQLFLERATKARPNFRPTIDNAHAISQICVRLDGIPLAIELAAARVRGLTVEQVAAGLDDRFRLLTGGARTVLPRQQTLQASVDWGYELLTDDERAVFRRLAVFAGGFTLDAAEQVTGTNGIDAVAVLEILLALVDKSMIVADGDLGRFRMLETLRQYASARLLDAGEMSAMRDRHLEWATGAFHLMDVLLSSLLDPFADHQHEIDNLRGAFEWAVLIQHADAAAELACFLSLWELLHGDVWKGIAIVEQALQLDGGCERLRLIMRARLAHAHYEAGEFAEAAVMAEQVAADSEQFDDEARSYCLRVAGFSLMHGGTMAQSFTYSRRAADVARRINRPDHERACLSTVAMGHMIRGEWREVRRSRPIWRATHDCGSPPRIQSVLGAMPRRMSATTSEHAPSSWSRATNHRRAFWPSAV